MFGKNWWPSNLHFLQNYGVMLPHVRPSFRSPGRALRRSPASAASRLSRGATAESFRWSKSGRCCITSNSGPRSAMPQRMNLNEIEQEVTISCTIQCFVPQKQSQKNGVSWIHSVHFEVANMPNIPTHSPEIPLRRKFSCLSAACCLIQQRFCNDLRCCIMQSTIFHLYIASSTSKQCNCIIVPQCGVPYNQHRFLFVPQPHHHHSSSSSSRKKWQQPSFWKDVSSRVLKIQRLYRNIVSIVCQGKGNCSRNWKQQSKKMRKWKGQPANLKTVTENTQSIPTTLWDHTTCTIASWFVSGVPFTAMCVSLV